MREYKLPHKRLNCIRRFLIYVVRTFEWMTPYLKGLYLTIDGWRERDVIQISTKLRVNHGFVLRCGSESMKIG